MDMTSVRPGDAPANTCKEGKMLHTPSLREIRRNQPENVVILPTAPARQVKQNYNRAAGAARRALREAQPWPQEYIDPRRRECLKRAEVINSVKQTPELRIVYALLGALDAETRQKVIETCVRVGVGH